MRFDALPSILVLAASVLPCAPAPAQTCVPHWSEMFPSAAGANVNAMATWDPDGSGPLPESLHLGRASLLERWDGTRRVSLAQFTHAVFPNFGTVKALARFDPDGSGPAPAELVVAGDFNGVGATPASNIVRWNGSTWSTLGSGTNALVGALLVFDEDAGGPNPPRLFAGGNFTSAGGVTARGIARWDGSSWSAVANTSNSVSVGALASFDADGAGPGAAVLVAGGFFSDIGGTSASNVARWNGTAWAALGAGSLGSLGALAEFDEDGAGPALPRLFAGGGLVVSGNQLGAWNGTTWSGAGNFTNQGSSSVVLALRVHDDDGAGPGAPALYAAGEFTDVNATTARGIARWNGAAWSEPGGGVEESAAICCPTVRCLASYDDDGSGTAPARLYVGGFFGLAGGAPAVGLARWNGTAWPGMQRGLDNAGLSLAVADLDGAGPIAPALFVGGVFDFAGSTSARRVARWDGAAWSALGTGLSAPTGYQAAAMAMAEFDEDDAGPNPPRLFVAGEFDNAGGVPVASIARWNGSTWSDVGGGVSGFLSSVRALAVFDEDGPGPGAPALFAGGAFTTAGGTSAESIARWDGTAWSAVGSGMPGGGVECLAVADLGTGAKLYAGGYFTSAGGASANHVASWDGASWAPLSSGMSGGSSPIVNALHAADLDGAGPGPTRLYAAGGFAQAGGVQVNRIAAWNGSAWSALASGLGGAPVTNFYIYSLGTLEPTGAGTGPSSLYASGFFLQNLGGVDTWGLARWDGAVWSSVGELVFSGPGVGAKAMRVFDEDGAGPVRPGLYLTGDFTSAGGIGSEHIARLGCSIAAPIAFCFGNGGSGPCPCGNAGAAGKGCNNSAGTGGAMLSAAGDPSLAGDTVVLTSAGEMPSALSIVLQGNLVIPPANFGDGIRCVGGNLKRLYVRNAVAGVVVAPQGLDPRVAARSATLGDPIPMGSQRHYLTYYRDPNLGFCPAPVGNTFNASNAVSISWNP